MRLEAFTQANVERCFGGAFKGGEDWTLGDWFMALMGELGEAANIAKKVRRGDFTIEEKRADLADELADVFTYLDLVAHVAGINLPEAVAKKWNEVSKRVGWPRTIHPTLGDPP